jgi:hypothetical protein
MLLYTATLKDGGIVLIREFEMKDKEKLFEFYESLTAEAVRWGMPPYTRESIERNWLSRLQNFIPFSPNAYLLTQQLSPFTSCVQHLDN